MAKRLTPSEIAKKQVRRAQAAVQDFKDGVMAVTENPMQKAAASQDKWMAGVQKAHDDNSFADGCNAVPLTEWQDATANKGGARYSSGVAASEGVIEEFHNQRKAKQEAISAQLKGMPRGDLQQNLARMLFNATEMSKFKFKKRRR